MTGVQARPSRGGCTVGKTLVGCLVLLALAVAGGVAAVGLGGFALMRGAESVFGGLDEHQEAGRMLERLNREHPFQAPADGAVSPELTRRFRAVTARAWEGWQPWAVEVRGFSTRDPRSSGHPPDAGEIVAGTRALGGLTRSRLLLARALSLEGSSLGEFVWTGHALARRDRAAFSGPEWGDADVSLVLELATMWAISESLVDGRWLDTMPRAAP